MYCVQVGCLRFLGLRLGAQHFRFRTPRFCFQVFGSSLGVSLEVVYSGIPSAV